MRLLKAEHLRSYQENKSLIRNRNNYGRFPWKLSKVSEEFSENLEMTLLEKSKIALMEKDKNHTEH